MMYENVVPDALLSKAWFVSKTSEQFEESICHTKQCVDYNRVKPDREYTVKIQLKDERRIRKLKQWTYAMTYYEEAVARGAVLSTFTQEVCDED